MQVKDQDFTEIINQLMQDSYQIQGRIQLSDIVDQSFFVTKIPRENVGRYIIDPGLTIDQYLKQFGSDLSSIFAENFTEEKDIVEFFTKRGFYFLNSKPFHYYCPCSKDRMVQNLIILGKNDLHHLFEENGKIDFSHNPFSMPQGGLEALNSQDPLNIKAFQYDIVCNGVELSSGAIRNHKPEIMYRAFELAGYGREVVEEKFGAMLNAFKYGAPPHGGIAPGIDRIIMLLADEPNIREVIPFPMNGKAQDLMMNAPANVSEKQLKELNVDLSKKARELLEK
jgi:hypothetical protein